MATIETVLLRAQHHEIRGALSKHRKNKRSFIASVSAVALGASVLSTVIPQAASAYVEATCPTGWTLAASSPALDGIYCDKATTTDISLEVPNSVNQILYLTVGGGGGGADGHVIGGNVYAGGGGGAGELSTGTIAVTPGDTFVVDFSEGGLARNDLDGQDGSDVSYQLNAGSSIVLSEGGSGGLMTGAGGAAGGESGLPGGAGSSSPNSVAGGGGGGWAFAGDDGELSPETNAGWGGQGIYFDETTETSIGPFLPTDEHWNSEFSELLQFYFVLPEGRGSSFYDYMGIGGPGGVVVQSVAEDPNEVCARAVGHYLEGDIMVSDKGLGTCYDVSNAYYATNPLTPEHPGMGGVGGTGTNLGTNGQVGLAYLRIYIPHTYTYELSASATNIGADDLSTLTVDAPDRYAAAFFIGETYVDGGLAWNMPTLTGSDVWENYGESIGGDCREIVLQARLYDPSVVEAVYDFNSGTTTLNLIASSGPPVASTSYLDSVDVTVSADSCSLEPAPESGPVSNSNPSKRPNTPTSPQVSVTTQAGSLNVAITYNGLSASRPASYKVSVSPGGNSCVAYGKTSSCDISGLKVGATYTVSIVAVNAVGESGTYVSPQKYFLTANGLASYRAKKNIDNFPGDSPKLLKPLKAKIKKFLTQHPEITNFTCTGYTAGPVKKSDKVLANSRASNVCAYVEKIKPSVSTTTIGKTPGLPWGPANRKVVIRGYSTAS